MAIQRRNLTQIIDEIYRISGNYQRADAGADTPWLTTANLVRIINDYIQHLPQRASQIVQKSVPRRPIRFDMYKTVTTSTATADSTTVGDMVVVAGGSLIYFPDNLDEIITLYNRTNDEPLHTIQDVSRFHKTLKERPPGPPEYYEILGHVTFGTAFRRHARLYPTTPAASTPDLELTYWRLPAIMAGSDPDTEYPDLDPKYQRLAIIGPMREILMPNDPAFDRVNQEEKGLLLDLVSSGRST